MKHLVVLSLIVAFAPTQSSAQTLPPTAGTEGKWEGSCVRGSQSVNTNVFIDQAGARMNGKGVSNFVKRGLSISFLVQGQFAKEFKGQFSPNTSSLNGTLTAQGKVATCTLARKVADPGRVCIRNPETAEIWWKLVPGNPASPVRLLGGSEDRGTGAAGGKLCWGSTSTEANACSRTLPQTSYACG